MSEPNYLKQIEVLRSTARRHKLPPGRCAYCDEERDNDFRPPHDASAGCHSGKRPHCSCDNCF